MTVRFVISTSTAAMNDPAKRIVDKSAVKNPEERREYKANYALAAYKASRVVLPSIWARKTVNHPSYYSPMGEYITRPPSKSELYKHREETCVLPFL